MVLQCMKKESAPVSVRVRALCSGLWTVSQDGSGERAEIPGSIHQPRFLPPHKD